MILIFLSPSSCLQQTGVSALHPERCCRRASILGYCSTERKAAAEWSAQTSVRPASGERQENGDKKILLNSFRMILLSPSSCLRRTGVSALHPERCCRPASILGYCSAKSEALALDLRLTSLVMRRVPVGLSFCASCAFLRPFNCRF